jgi:FlaA1/EpsC-like NDP-sugar epimerase
MRGVYHSLLRFSGGGSIRDLGESCLILAVPLTVSMVGLRVPQGMPRTLAVLIPLIFFIFLAMSRIVLSALLRETLYSRSRNGRQRVLVYGAGVGGRELVQAIKEDPEFRVVGFVDDNPVLRGRRMEGHRIWHSSDLEQVLAKNTVDEILLAMPTAPRVRRRDIIENVRALAPSVRVRSLPNLSEIASGRRSVSDLREVQIEELLGRDQVEPDLKLMSANILGQCVAVTGAGGSIGSELCRQIVMQCPSKIVLAERSELALYEIERELNEMRKRHGLEFEIEPKLVDVADRHDIARVFRQCRPDAVFHAAAYKHVPLVEADPIAGIRNNVLGTYHSCLVAEECNASNFTLVSTDKAVRPSSVMGASKRVCELMVLARAAAQTSTTYSAVRFGNVLGSSGSVVPLFRRQIASGGPVTVTHRDATRYFMTVPEAAQLVVQAGAMAKGGEIFLLDMGEPVRIEDVARMMIQLSGLAIAADGMRNGDIEIVEIGLRPGEKVHEELLIDHCGLPTSHPRIVKASESGTYSPQFDAQLAELLVHLETRDSEAALATLQSILAIDADPERSSELKSVSVANLISKRQRSASSSKTEEPRVTAGQKRALEI